MFGTINLETYFDQITDQGWAIIDVDIQFADELRDRLNTLILDDAFVMAGLANSIFKISIRNDFISWINNESDQVSEKKLFVHLNTLRRGLRDYFRMPLVDIEAHYAHYPKNHFYKKHTDQSSIKNRRFFSFVIYLNTAWRAIDGGQICGYKKNLEIFNINPDIGKMILFKSELEHEVLECFTDRYSIAGWIRTA